MGTITNPTPLTNGTTVSFDETSADNFYSFTLNSAGSVLIVGSDGSNSYYYEPTINMKIYDSNFAAIDSFLLSESASRSLSAGTYYIQAIDSYGGTFSVSSNAMSGTPISESTLNLETSSFVERLYTNVLGRNSDSDGLANWVDTLETSNAADVAKSFFNSQEFLNANYSNSEYVQKLYLTFMDRTYDEGGLTHWVSQLNSGISRDTVLDGFAGSAEFATIAQDYGVEAYSNLSTVESFVERFYTEVLGRPSDAAGLQNWSDSLENGSKTADDIAEGFFFSTEFTNQNLSDSDFVDVAYETLLNREADSGGKSNWLSQLSGGLSRDDMLDGFIYSAEFDTLAQSYGIEVGVQEQPQLEVLDDGIDINDIAGLYNLLYADASLDGMEIHLDGSDVTGSYMNIASNGNVTMHVEYMGEEMTLSGQITEITDVTVTVYADGEEFEYGYVWDDPYLTTNVEIYELGISYSETDHWVLA